jgi:CheY-like chemotaxis protein
MVTAYAMSFDRQRFLEAGADGYVSKPIDAQALQAEIHRLLPQFVSAAA